MVKERQKMENFTVGGVVTFNNRGPGFESSHQHLFTANCRKDDKKKWPAMVHLNK